MESNTYTDIYCGFIERENSKKNDFKYDMPAETSKTSKKEEKKETVAYTDIYNGFIEVVEKVR